MWAPCVLSHWSGPTGLITFQVQLIDRPEASHVHCSQYASCRSERGAVSACTSGEHPVQRVDQVLQRAGGAAAR
jgi:hypothetical protein